MKYILILYFTLIVFPACYAQVYFNFENLNPESSKFPYTDVFPISRINSNDESSAIIGNENNSSGYSSASGGNNIGLSAKMGKLNISTSSYFEISLISQTEVLPITGISFGSFVTDKGPLHYVIRTSADNYETDCAFGTFETANTWTFETIKLYGVYASPKEKFSIRIYPIDNSCSCENAGINWKIDDLNLFSQPNHALPVSLTYFSYRQLLNAIQLNWNTSNETDNQNFFIFRSADQKHIDTLGSIAGNGTSTKNHSFSFLDQHPNPGKNYYQLIQVDRNGENRWLGALMATFNTPVMKLSLLNRTISLELTSPENCSGAIRIYDIQSRSVLTETIQIRKGYNIFSIPASDAPGVFVLVLESPFIAERVKFMNY